MKKKMKFSANQAKVKSGIPKALKIMAISAMTMGSFLACEPEVINISDSCRTTTTDINNPDLGAQQDPNTNCDND